MVAGAVSAKPLVYEIDAVDTIVGANDAWFAFAEAHGAPDLVDRTLGTSLWSHIDNPELVLIWRALVEQTRAGETVVVGYGCKSCDGLLRYEMELTPLQDRAVRLAARPSERPVVSAAARAREALVLACPWCRRFLAGTWVDARAAVQRLRLLDLEPPPRITHGICGDCHAQLGTTLHGAA